VVVENTKKTDLKELERRRVKAAKLLNRGITQAEVARQVGVSRESVRRWANRIALDGLAGLKRAERTGRPGGLNGRDFRRLLELLEAGPEKSGYSNGLWTLDRVAAVIEKEFGVHYHRGHVWKLLQQKLNWSCQRPIGRARERKETEIRRWKEEVWPALKKKPKPKAEPSSS
jgi:transposase